MLFENWIKDSGQSTTDIAFALGVSEATVRRIASGKTKGRPSTASDIETLTKGKVKRIDLVKAYHKAHGLDLVEASATDKPSHKVVVAARRAVRDLAARPKAVKPSRKEKLAKSVAKRAPAPNKVAKAAAKPRAKKAPAQATA